MTQPLTCTPCRPFVFQCPPSRELTIDCLDLRQLETMWLGAREEQSPLPVRRTLGNQRSHSRRCSNRTFVAFSVVLWCIHRAAGIQSTTELCLVCFWCNGCTESQSLPTYLFFGVYNKNSTLCDSEMELGDLLSLCLSMVWMWLFTIGCLSSPPHWPWLPANS